MTEPKAPNPFRTLAGPDPELAALYGLREHPDDAYPPRTEANVRESDANHLTFSQVVRVDVTP